MAVNHPEWLLAAAILVGCAVSAAQNSATPAAKSTVPAPYRVEGTDSGSGTHFVRLSVWSSTAGMTDLAPRFTLECRDLKGKHDLLWFVSFGGVPVQSFEPPFKPSQGDPFPPSYQKLKLKMDFEGYMRSKVFTGSWEELPSGELRFCNAGFGCSNMETARYYMSYLNALPTLRIAYAKSFDSNPPPEELFDLRNLVDEANKTPVCIP